MRCRIIGGLHVCGWEPGKATSADETEIEEPDEDCSDGVQDEDEE